MVFKKMSTLTKKIGALGFEPRTSWSQTMRAKPDCATPRIIYILNLNGARLTK